MQESSQRTTIKRIKKDFRLMPGFAIRRRFASLRCERQAALVMRTIRRQVYARDRHLALLQLRQGKCRCAVTVRTSAGCPRRGCASPTLRTFRPVVAKISRKPYCGLFDSRLLHCTISYFALQRKLHGLSTGFRLAGDDWGATWRRLGGRWRGPLGAPKEVPKV